MAALTTNVGEEYTVDKLLDKTGSITTRPEYLGWGTGAAPGETATDLTTAANESRVLATCTKSGTGDSATYHIVGTITAGGARTITEVGVFTTAGTGNPPTGGSLIFASDHTSTVLASGEGIQYTIDVNPE